MSDDKQQASVEIKDPLLRKKRRVVGKTVTCLACGLRKKPVGRDAPAAMANSLCDHECPGYRKYPEPGDLWPGETREEFGF